jgi:hypothetical protein
MNGNGKRPADGRTPGGYERPNQRWVCGWSRDGNPCAFGPDGKGRCPAQQETGCTPVGMGDRYRCTRPMVFGGPCEQGPLPDGSCCHPPLQHPPCQPRLSLRATRGRVVRGVLLALLGLLTLGLGRADLRQAMIDPGGLSAAHEPIGAGVNRGAGCGACHAGAEQGPSSWLVLAFDGKNGQSDSKRCLACHFRGDAGHAFLPHGVEPERLDAAMARYDAAQGGAPTKASPAKTAGPAMPARPADELACGTCHREHRGKYARIAFLANTECQACHKHKYDSFAGTHPDFLPLERLGGGIKFDHRLHQREHYAKDQPFLCATCHTLDAGGKAMLAGNYQATCAGCHNAGNDDHHGGRITAMTMAAFELPALTLQDGSSPWPKDAKTAIEVPPLMQLLLAGDDAAAKALASLQKDGGDPTDWPGADDHPEYPQALAHAVHALIGELQSDDSQWLHAEIGDLMHQPPESGKVGDLYSDLRDGADSVRGDLATVLASVSSAADVQQLAEDLGTGAKSAASLSDTAHAVGCPGASDADQKALATAIAQGGGKPPDCFKARAAAVTAATSDLADLRQTAAEGLGVDDDDDAVNRLLGDLFRFGRRTEFRIARALDVSIADPVVEPLARALDGARPALANWFRAAAGMPAEASPSAQETGGWSWDAKSSSVMYRATGHEDPLFRDWINAALASRAAAGSDRALVAQGLERKVAGTECVRCHALDHGPSGAAIAWTSAGRASITGAFAKFDHQPHVALLGDTGCKTCHAFAASDAAGAAARGFERHQKKVCAECHRPGQANTDCLSCHNYHLGAR